MENKGINNIYDQLLIKASDLDHKTISEKWPRVCGIINKLPVDHIKIIFLLIIHHGINENSRNISSMKSTLSGRSRQIYLPYSGRVLDSGKGVIYKMSSLPEDLQKIIYRYIETVSSQ